MPFYIMAGFLRRTLLNRHEFCGEAVNHATNSHVTACNGHKMPFYAVVVQVAITGQNGFYGQIEPFSMPGELRGVTRPIFKSANTPPVGSLGQPLVELICSRTDCINSIYPQYICTSRWLCLWLSI